MHRKLFILSSILLITVLLSSCAQPGTEVVEPIPTELPKTGLSEGAGSIAGQIPEATATWPGELILVYAAPFYTDDAGQDGFYLLETGSHPYTELDQEGRFTIKDVSPGKYVLIVGPRPEEGLLAIDPEQEPLIIEVAPGQAIALGELQVANY